MDDFGKLVMPLLVAVNNGCYRQICRSGTVIQQRTLIQNIINNIQLSIVVYINGSGNICLDLLGGLKELFGYN